VAPTCSTLQALALLRDFVGPSYSEKQLTQCLTESGYDVERAAEMLLTQVVPVSSTSCGMESAKRGSLQGQGAKNEVALSDWTNRFGFASSKSKRKHEDSKPSASSLKRIKVGASLAAASGSRADTKPAASTGNGTSDKTCSTEDGGNGAAHKPESKKPKIVDLLMVRWVRSLHEILRARLHCLFHRLTQQPPSSCRQDAFEAFEITSTTATTTASIRSDPEASKVIAALKRHRKLESILQDDVGPRHEYSCVGNLNRTRFKDQSSNFQCH
jgi:hypothetical protein